MDEVGLLARVNELIEDRGCIATELGPDSVGVQGDARVLGPSVYVRFPQGASDELIREVSADITNRVPRITRVLMEIDV
ncbi:MAG: hypothetical protein WDZ90_00045 [Candidatus Paceibacterota bacterium]